MNHFREGDVVLDTTNIWPIEEPFKITTMYDDDRCMIQSINPVAGMILMNEVGCSKLIMK